MERREKRFASRILAWFLTFLMITTMIPTSAFAALPAQDTGAVVSEDASSDETTQDGILLKTTLTDKLKVKGQRKLFDVWARDAEDNTLKPTATLDGQVLSATWSDNVKTRRAYRCYFRRRRKRSIENTDLYSYLSESQKRRIYRLCNGQH